MISDLFRVSQRLSDLSLLHRPPLFQIKQEILLLLIVCVCVCTRACIYIEREGERGV